MVCVTPVLPYTLAALLAATPAEPPREPASPFHLVLAIDPDAARLSVLGNSVVVRHDSDGLALARFDSDGFVLEPPLANGIAHCSLLFNAAFSGVFPESAWLVKDLNPWSACPEGPAHVFRWNGKRWNLESTLAAHQVFVAPWTRGSALMVEVPHRTGPPWGYELRVLGGPAGLKAPKPRRAQHAEAGCYSELETPLALVTGRDGSALVLGQSRCGSPSDDEVLRDDAVVEYFAPKAKTGRIYAVPFTGSSEGLAFFAREPRDFWVAGTAGGEGSVLARFDGRRWTQTKGPPAAISAFGVAAAGAVWALARKDGVGSVWHRPPGGGFAQVPLPPEAGEPRSLRVRGSGDAWLIAERGIYSTATAAHVLTWPQRECNDEERARADADESATAEHARKAGFKDSCRFRERLAPELPFR